MLFFSLIFKGVIIQNVDVLKNEDVFAVFNCLFILFQAAKVVFFTL